MRSDTHNDINKKPETHTTQGSKEEVLKDQVSSDLKTKLAEFNDPKKGIKVMAMLMGVHEKTLRRLISKENKPGYQTLLKIYRTLFSSKNDNELLSQVPSVIKEFIISSSTRTLNDSTAYQIDITEELKRDPVFCEIYFLLGTGGVSKEYIAFNYGTYGEKKIEKMLRQKIAAPIRKDFYVLGLNQASLDGETLSLIGQHLIKNFHKPENGDEMGSNYLSLYAEGLSEEAYLKWIKIEEKAFKEKVEIAKDPKNHGNYRAFTVAVVDTLDETSKSTKH